MVFMSYNKAPFLSVRNQLVYFAAGIMCLLDLLKACSPDERCLVFGFMGCVIPSFSLRFEITNLGIGPRFKLPFFRSYLEHVGAMPAHAGNIRKALAR